jgi:hypothetical protein
VKGLLDGDIAVAPKRIKPPGKKAHRLAYIDGDEAALLRSRGGGVAPDGSQIMRNGLPSYEEGGDAADSANSNSEASTQDAGADVGADPSAGVDGGHNGPAGTDTDASNGGDQGYTGNGQGGGWVAPPPPPPGPPVGPGSAPVLTYRPATPVYTDLMPAQAPPVQGVAPAGMQQGLEAMRSLFGPRPMPTPPPQAPGGLQALGSDVPMGAWSPPPVAPVQYPQEAILTGMGGNAAYYDAMQRLAPQQAQGMGYFDALRRYRGW